MKLMGLSWGAPFSNQTYCSIPASIFSALEHHQQLAGALSSKFPRLGDAFRGVVDLPKSLQRKHLVRNAYWRYFPENQKLLSKRFAEATIDTEYDGVLQFGVAVRPDKGFHMAHIEITLETASSIPEYAESYGFNDHRALESAIAGEKAFINSCDAIWTNSEWTAQGFLDYSIAPEKIMILQPCFADGAYRVIPREFDYPRILFIGRDWKRKGLPELLKAFPSIKKEHPRAELHVVGVQGISNSDIHYYGEVDKSTEKGKQLFLSILGNSNILCLPSRWESTGIVCLEAAATGMPVALSTGQGREKTFPGPTFFHIEAITASSIADTIITAFEDKDYLYHLQTALPAFVKENFSVETRYSALSALFEKLKKDSDQSLQERASV